MTAIESRLLAFIDKIVKSSSHPCSPTEPHVEVGYDDFDGMLS